MSNTVQTKLLFVCIENSNRSQMAEAFARHHGGARVLAASSGSRPSGVVNPKAIAAMRRRGIDISRHQSKPLDQLPQVTWDWVITMGCGDVCPFIPSVHHDDWKLPDPKHMEPTEFDQVRDEIERRVVELLGTCGVAASANEGSR